MSKIFVQYGAGNIGRGFIGMLFSKAGYEVHFIDVNMEVINALNADNKYPVNIVSSEGDTEVSVENVHGVNGMDIDAICDIIGKADLMASSVGVNILPRIVPNIAAALRRRWESGNLNPLNILICENLLDADKFLRGLFEDIFTDPKERKLFDETVGLVETSIGRMVPVMSEEMKKGSVLRVCVERYFELPVDKNAFKGEIPEIDRMHPFAPFEYFIRRKLFVHNMGHALSAYLGSVNSCDYIWQCIEDPYVKLVAARAMHESATALSKKFGVPLADITEHIADLLLRFSNRALGDTVARVGKDIKRKLAKNDRLCGAALLCEEQGINSVYICAGIAAALFFPANDDKGTEEIKALIEKDGIDALLVNHCGLSENSDSFGYVKEFYNLLSNGAKMPEVLALAEKLHGSALGRKVII